MENSQAWLRRIGRQRDWVWRGWQTRYSFIKAPHGKNDSAPPLIFIHGFGAAIEHWRHNLPFLSQTHTVYALDLLGFGASRKADTNYSIHLWVEQVYDFWRTFIQIPVVLVGNSIGSLVCFTAAATHPEMVAGIVMISVPDLSLLQKDRPQWTKTLEARLKPLVAPAPLLGTLFKVLRLRTVIRLWARVAYAQKEAITGELVEILAAPARDEAAEKAFYRLFQGVSLPEFAPSAQVILPRLSLPMLIFWGREDRMVPFSLAKRFVALNPQLELVALDNLGHCLHDESPETFNPLLLEWLQKYFPRVEPKTSDYLA